MKKIIGYICIVLLWGIFISCTQSSQQDSYEGVVIINGSRYTIATSDIALEKGDLIGIVVHKTLPQGMPEGELESNILEKAQGSIGQKKMRHL